MDSPGVSLFTREWIEISGTGTGYYQILGSPSLRGSGLKFFPAIVPFQRHESPSLRGSGLKYSDICKPLSNKAVSLFTREWIEMQYEQCNQLINDVSLFTREWIEIPAPSRCLMFAVSVSLFTREWIEIKKRQQKHLTGQRSPSLRGSGLKCIRKNTFCHTCNSLPLYEGVD